MSDEEADDVLAHSEDEGEWDDEPVDIEVRPSGNQVLSARIPTALAEMVFDEAAHRNVTMSEVVRAAIESYFQPRVVAVVKVFPSDRIRLHAQRADETVNPVVSVPEFLRLAI